VPVSFPPRIEHSILFRYLRAVKSPLLVPLQRGHKRVYEFSGDFLVCRRLYAFSAQR